MGRYLGLDFGEKRVGVALSDEDKKFSFPQETITYDNIGDLTAQLRKTCQVENVEKIIIGLPVDLQGRKNTWTKKVESFAEAIGKALGLNYDFQDERLTSKMTMSLFKETKRKKIQKGQIDAISARIILQDYLDKLSL